MKNCFIKKLAPTKIAIADLCDYYNKGLIITRISVPTGFRGTGEGTKLLKEICNEADKTKTVLFLEILPSGPLNYTALEKWYKKYGFRDYYGMYRRRFKR